MSKRKRYILGKIYITNDSLFSKDGYKKANRRIVAINNDKNQMQVVKIKGLYDKNGNLRKNVTPIENYSCLTKPSGIDKTIYKQTARKNPITETRLKKTNCRLNKWDIKKLPKPKK